MSTKVRRKTTGAFQEENAVQDAGFDYELREVPLKDINADSSKFNYRLTRLDQETAVQYAVAMENGDAFPPIVVHDEPGISGFVIDSGVHRYHARTITTEDTISAIVLKNLDLADTEVSRKLDELRVVLNLTHGRPLDQAERKLTACNWIASGKMTEAEAAKFFDLDPKALNEAVKNFNLNIELRQYGLNPENFQRMQDKESVLKKGLTQQDMKELERLLVRYTAEDSKRKPSTARFRQLCNQVLQARSPREKTRVIEAFRAEMAQKRKVKTKKHRGHELDARPQFHLGSVDGHIQAIDTPLLLSEVTNSETARKVHDRARRCALQLADISNQVAEQWDLSTLTVEEDGAV